MHPSSSTQLELLSAVGWAGYTGHLEGQECPGPAYNLRSVTRRDPTCTPEGQPPPSPAGPGSGSFPEGASQLRQEDREGANQGHVPLTGGVSGLKEQQVQRCWGGKEASTFGEAERLQQCEGGSYAEDATREGLHLGAGAQVGLTRGSGCGVGVGVCMEAGEDPMTSRVAAGDWAGLAL